MSTQIVRIENYVRQWPGRTQREIATGLYGARGYQQRVNQDFALLVTRGRIQRCGVGGLGGPYRYYSVSECVDNTLSMQSTD
jgi:hypothetical protein